MPFKVIGTIAVVAGTPVRLTSGQLDPAAAYPCQAIRVEGLVGNTGAVKVGDATVNASADTGVAASLVKPAATGPVSVFELRDGGGLGSLSLADFYIDGANSNDKVFVSVLTG